MLMANVVVLGGGFGGVVAAEQLAKVLGDGHQVTLVSRSSRFVFYPALVRLAFGKCTIDDISFNLRTTMLDRRIRFIEAEVARVEPSERRVVLADGDISGDLPFDFLIFALGRRLATERVEGFFEHAHHLMTVESALKFGDAVKEFHEGSAVIGYCQGSRLAVPVYETAFELSRQLEKRGERDGARITIVSPDQPSDRIGGTAIAGALRTALDEHDIEYLPDFAINKLSANEVQTTDGVRMKYDLLMLVPPFSGAPAVIGTAMTDDDGFIRVDRRMRVHGFDRIYAAGDCVKLSGPKLGHMAIRQGEVAAQNVISEIEGREPAAEYKHEMMLVIDEGGHDSIYLRQDLWDESTGTVRQGRFWSWAKRMQERYWQHQHS
jgi:sulfide:quinone oxidoreductase